MAKAGKQLELLVAQLERSLGPATAAVESPGFLPDRVTGVMREVDVLISAQVGSCTLNIIAECRDRNMKQDVTWIEQLAQKRNDLAVSKAIAVSPLGFSEAALKKASFHGIDVRRVEELTPELLRGWFRVLSFTLYKPRTQIHGVRIQAVGPAPGGTMPVKAADSAFVWNFNGESDSLGGLLDRSSKRFDLHAGVPEDGTRIRRTVELTPLPNELSVRTPGGPVHVSRLLLDLELWIDPTTIPLHRVYSYRSDAEGLVETIEYLMDLEDHREIVALHKDLRTGRYRVSRRFEDGRADPLPHAMFRMRDEQDRDLL